MFFIKEIKMIDILLIIIHIVFLDVIKFHMIQKEYDDKIYYLNIDFQTNTLMPQTTENYILEKNIMQDIGFTTVPLRQLYELINKRNKIKTK